jgi:hypothetical protein
LSKSTPTISGVAEWEYELKFFRKINNDPLRLCAFACKKKIMIDTLIMQSPISHSGEGGALVLVTINSRVFFSTDRS